MEYGARGIVYVVNGHGELEMGSSVSGLLEKENFECRTLGLLTVDEVPEDADALLINSPGKDLTEEEAELLLSYLKSGGHAVIIMDYIGEVLPNLEAVIEYYGVKTEQGIVMEQDSSHYIQLPYYILPDVHYTQASAQVY